MISSFDKSNLEGLLYDFYTAVGIRISIFDDEFSLVTEYPERPPEFCALIRASGKGLEGCRRCDAAACNRAKKLHKPHIYTCHAGLTEAITPIQLGGGVVGYAILAHMMPGENYEKAMENACRLAQGYGVPEEKSLAAVRAITPRSSTQINAAVHILDAVSAYVQIRNLARWKNDDIAVEIEKYIRENLARDITSQTLCEKFHCSRSALYHISMQAFGMGIKQYVAFIRMENAKKMLSSGADIAQTAAENGFKDYSYFCRAFRRETGCTPARYRDKFN